MYRELTQEQIIKKYNDLSAMAKDLGLETRLTNGFCVFHGERLIECAHTVDELQSYLNGFKAAQMFAAMGG